MKLYYEWDDDRLNKGYCPDFANRVVHDILLRLTLPTVKFPKGEMEDLLVRSRAFNDIYFYNLPFDENAWYEVNGERHIGVPQLRCEYMLPRAFPAIPLHLLVFNNFYFSDIEKDGEKFLEVEWDGYMHLKYSIHVKGGYYVETDENSIPIRIIDFFTKTRPQDTTNIRMDRFTPDQLITVWEREE